MPYINKKSINSKSFSNSPKENLRKSYYNTLQWRNLRRAKLMQNPICEKCKQDLTTDIHHIKSPFEECLSQLERDILFYDFKNLMSLCKKCHGEIHGKKE